MLISSIAHKVCPVASPSTSSQENFTLNPGQTSGTRSLPPSCGSKDLRECISWPRHLPQEILDVVLNWEPPAYWKLIHREELKKVTCICPRPQLFPGQDKLFPKPEPSESQDDYSDCSSDASITPTPSPTSAHPSYSFSNTDSITKKFNELSISSRDTVPALRLNHDILNAGASDSDVKEMKDMKVGPR